MKYEWYIVLAWILGAIGGIGVFVTVIMTLWDRRARIAVRVTRAHYGPPGPHRNSYVVDLVLAIEHIGGPASQILRVDWKGTHDKSRVECPTLGRVNYVAEDGNCVTIEVPFDLESNSVKVQEDGTIEGKITIRGTRKTKASVTFRVPRFRAR